MSADEQRMRERFEDWGRTYYLNLIRTRGGQYQDVLTEAAYAAWRARDAEVQELRKALAEIVDCHVAIEEHRENGHVSRDAVNAWWGAARIARAALAGGETGEPE